MLASRGAPWFPGKGGALQTIYTPTDGYTASSASEFTHRLFPSPWRALEFTDAESVETNLTGSWERVRVHSVAAYAICIPTALMVWCSLAQSVSNEYTVAHMAGWVLGQKYR